MSALYDDKSRGSSMNRENNGIFKATSKTLVGPKFEKLVPWAKPILLEFKKYKPFREGPSGKDAFSSYSSGNN